MRQYVFSCFSLALARALTSAREIILLFSLLRYDITNADMVDLSIRERQIGSYLTMIDRNRSSHSGDRVYTSKERSILAYNEDKDDWYMFELLQAVQHSGIWNEDGSLRGITKAWNVPHFNEDIKHDHLLMKNDDDGKRVPIEVLHFFLTLSCLE